MLALLFLMLRNPDKPADEPIALPSGLPSQTPTREPLKELPTAAATPSTAAQVQAQTKKAFEQFGKGLTGGASGTIDMPGLQGGSIYKYLPKHKVTMRITSEAPIGTVGYVVPTSLKNSSGIVKNVGTSWSLTTTAYGDPDYAQLFMAAGSRGYPVYCTITVDGKVTEQRHTEGPYGQLICQG
ncbi:hypothetical protein EFK50_10305 [Nocardioides marmoriginsengisoli]|uniref:Uncharacterized protein n=1 Tax=Nocardioides marmoriginsengisoli TaxID=661483 RepID=A0A3N0CFE6_9ACTN|nr:hypothetical protein EFK50_10305 [Nocardioides marmoriginsengisoli]